MSLVNRLSPYVTSALSSHGLKRLRRQIVELQRKRRGQSHEVVFFHKVDDPYSYLLLQLVQRLMGDFDIKVKPHIISELNAKMFPEPALLNDWSLKDAKFLAKIFDLKFPDAQSLPQKALCLRAERILLANERSDSFLKFALDVNEALWIEGENAINKLEQEVGRVSEEQREHLVKKSQSILKSKGHYLSATLFYGGEWYWGADRIFHLAKRLNAFNISKTKIDLSHYDYPSLSKPLKSKNSSPVKVLDFYFSFRSPYSYLAGQRLLKLKQEYNLDINVKTVLPMVMRGLTVPTAKRMYIFLDTKRECERYRIPFGKAVDPLGEGVNRSMSIFPYAQAQGLALEYIASVSKGIWAEGKDVTKDGALKQLIERIGLSWQEALPYLKDKSWGKNAEQNRKDMLACGFWGVPSFQYGKQCFWGQDRLWAIEKLISTEE